MGELMEYEGYFSKTYLGRIIFGVDSVSGDKDCFPHLGTGKWGKLIHLHKGKFMPCL